MIGTTLGLISAVIVVLALLFVFALWYNHWISDLGPAGEGFAWLEVVGGVFVTLIGLGLLDMVLSWNAFFSGLLAFTASGIPMSWGAYRRHKEAIGRALKAMKE